MVAGICVALAPGCAHRVPVVARHDGATAAKLDGINQKIVATTAASTGGREYTVGPEDLLEISLFDIEQDESGKPERVPARVSQSGLISLPLIGRIAVAGRTVLEIESLLRDRYRRFIHDPQVTVFIKEYRSYRISVLGHVTKPGLYEVSGDKTLLEALSLAGGLAKEAGTIVQLTRRTEQGLQTLEIDLSKLLDGSDPELNVPLQSGDVVTVPKASVFFVVGSVIRPGAYPIRKKVTVSQAIATAGGPNQRIARVGGTKLYRQMPDGEREEIDVNLKAIRAGRAEDPAIAQNDVVVVPMNRAKYITELLLGRVGIGLSPGF